MRVLTALVGLLIPSLRAPLLIAAAEVDRPNIVFVITDDRRYDYLGCAGHPVLKTPHIDRIAREGAIFRNFFVVTPLCSPSRATFLTGLYPHAHRIINNDRIGLDAISHTLVTFPRMLREAGYETAFVGKWHMGSDDSRRPGFDRWVSFRGQGIYVDGVVNEDGRQVQLTGHMADYLNDQAVQFIERPRAKPFALYLAHKGVHRPYLPTWRHDHLYTRYWFEPPAFPKSDLAGKPALTRRVDEKVDVLRMEGAVPEPAEPRRGRGTSPQEVVRDQFRCIADVDEGVGRIFEALERTKQLDNTVLIFTSDNGYLMGEHGLFDNKRWAYEPSIRVPFVARYPKRIKPGTSIDAMVVNVDVAPTLLELAGAKPYVRMHGRSFVPLLGGDQKVPWRTSFLAEYFTEKVGPRVQDWQAVRTGRWKYIHYPALQGMDELYDLVDDPNEWKNRIADPEARTTLDDLRGELKRLLAETKGTSGD